MDLRVGIQTGLIFFQPMNTILKKGEQLLRLLDLFVLADETSGTSGFTQGEMRQRVLLSIFYFFFEVFQPFCEDYVVLGKKLSKAAFFSLRHDHAEVRKDDHIKVADFPALISCQSIEESFVKASDSSVSDQVSQLVENLSCILYIFDLRCDVKKSCLKSSCLKPDSSSMFSMLKRQKLPKYGFNFFDQIG